MSYYLAWHFGLTTSHTYELRSNDMNVAIPFENIIMDLLKTKPKKNHYSHRMNNIRFFYTFRCVYNTELTLYTLVKFIFKKLTRPMLCRHRKKNVLNIRFNYIQMFAGCGRITDRMRATEQLNFCLKLKNTKKNYNLKSQFVKKYAFFHEILFHLIVHYKRKSHRPTNLIHTAEN